MQKRIYFQHSIENRSKSDFCAVGFLKNIFEELYFELGRVITKI